MTKFNDVFSRPRRGKNERRHQAVPGRLLVGKYGFDDDGVGVSNQAVAQEVDRKEPTESKQVESEEIHGKVDVMEENFLDESSTTTTTETLLLTKASRRKRESESER